MMGDVRGGFKFSEVSVEIRVRAMPGMGEIIVAERAIPLLRKRHLSILDTEHALRNCLVYDDTDDNPIHYLCAGPSRLSEPISVEVFMSDGPSLPRLWVCDVAWIT